MTFSTRPRNASVQPWIVTPDTAGLLDFVVDVFGAVEVDRVRTEDGSIGHAEFHIGDTWLLAFDSRPDWPPTPALLRVFVDDAAAVVDKAAAAGARVVTPLADAAWGDRGGRIRDPFGNIWWVVQHVEDVPPEVMAERLGEPQYADAMRTAQETLDAELGGSDSPWSSRPVL